MKLFAPLLYASIFTIGINNPTAPKTHQMAGITAQWHFDEEEHLLCIDLVTPGDGWIAVGFNNKRQFVGSNLIMASQANGLLTVEDQFITGMGEHPSVEQLAGTSHIANAEMNQQHDGNQQLTLHIITQPTDNFHYILGSGKRIYLTLAYSSSPDFDHHSVQRASVWINL